jgi:hypothetical protein
MEEMRKDYRIPETENGYLELKVYYSLGGMNYFNGKSEQRGIWFMATTVQKEGNWRSFRGFGDITGKNIENGKICLIPLKRKSQKKLEAVANAMPWDEVAKLWLKGEYPAALKLVEGAAEKVDPKVAVAA